MQRRLRSVLALSLSGVLVLGSFGSWYLWRLWGDTDFWIRRQGGVEQRYLVDLSQTPSGSGRVLEEVRDVVARRLRSYGFRRFTVSTQGENELGVRFAGTDPSASNIVTQIVARAGALSFHLVAPEEHQTPEQVQDCRLEEQAYLAADRDWVARKVKDPSLSEERSKPPELIVRSKVGRVMLADGWCRVQSKPGGEQVLRNGHRYDPVSREWVPTEWLGGRFLSHAATTVNQWTHAPAVALTLTSEGASMLDDLTRAHIGGGVAIVLDDEILQSAPIPSRIDGVAGSAQITGEFSDEDVRRIVAILRGGCLPVELKLFAEQSIAPEK